MDIYPSLISSNLINLHATLTTFDPICSGYHLDIMDNHFVPNLTWGPMFVNAIREQSSLPLHIHAMVSNPISILSRLTLRTCDTFIFHYESVKKESLLSVIETIREKNIKAGIAISPQTPVEDLFDILAYLDMVLLMSVEPGFSGQKFIPEVVTKIAPLFHMKKQGAYTFVVGMDGGIDTSNIALLTHAHVNNVAIASAIFGKKNPADAFAELHRCALRK